MAFDKRQLAQEIERDRRDKVAQRLSDLGRLLKAARRERRERVEQIRLRCRAARERLRANCNARKARARAEGELQIEERRREIAEERQLDRLQRSATRRGASAAKRGRSLRGERDTESDDEVRRNVPPELVAVFNRMRRTIKGSPRKSRSEAFLEWAEENPGEIYVIQEKTADREVKRLVAEYERLSRPGSRGSAPF